MVRLQQSYSPHSGVLPERAAHFAVGYAVECRDGRADSRERDHNTGGPSLFQPGDRIVDEYSKEEFHVDQFLGKGGFAECFAVRSNRFRGQFALKVVEKAKLKDPSYSKMHREINLHRYVLKQVIFSLENVGQSPIPILYGCVAVSKIAIISFSLWNYAKNGHFSH
ncbi:hypothetical protein ANCCAN_11605 [Ancylostoma caninum]|uniref:Protein kinase domain-containing protein n=1 Tax=Ancylostoma caninum TaxID=29170 RepID=A0A368GDH1_ANCCA|nr:hypothetical protein ANCCAN_11605 [Ancylostoma caninum]